MVQWKEFIVESDIWERGENLENAKKLVNKFKRRLGAENRKNRRKM